MYSWGLDSKAMGTLFLDSIHVGQFPTKYLKCMSLLNTFLASNKSNSITHDPKSDSSIWGFLTPFSLVQIPVEK